MERKKEHFGWKMNLKNRMKEGVSEKWQKPESWKKEETRGRYTGMNHDVLQLPGGSKCIFSEK